MKHFVKILTLSVSIAVTAPLASATPITGTIITNAAITTSGSDNSFLNFSNPGSVATGQYAPTGTLAGLAGDSVTFNNFDYATVGTPFLLYSGNDATIGAFSFTITQMTTCAFQGTAYFSCMGTGTMSENGFSSVNSTFFLGGNQSGTINFSETNMALATAATPEPSSLMLLGTGLVSAAGMLVRRRRLT